ncbi:MAG TPA: cytochrome d ubiquinol oxidase subunit II, partial [Anaerolineae bacterium]|nr:cytochrome d ubiquinol oxidase subunit II [Anaerolineae bacterium]
GMVTNDFISAWFALFPFLLGLLVLSLFAFLAAVYLTNETDDPALQEDFRLRALVSGAVVGIFAFLTLLAARSGAPRLFSGLSQYWWAWLGQAVTGLVSVGAMAAMWKRWYGVARLLAIAQVTAMILGWGVAQFPFIVPPDLTFAATAAPDSVLKPVFVILIIGILLIVPAFAFLYYTFSNNPQSK